MDWNDDGSKDLITGEAAGYIRVYLNIHTDAEPMFSEYFYVEVAGTPFKCAGFSVPWVVDWNEDGRKDLLCGEHWGLVHLMINTGTNEIPQFTLSRYIQDGTADLDVGEHSSPAVVDFNRDGKKDLLSGDFYGELFYYENKGSNEAPLFNGGVKLTAGEKAIDVGFASRPFPDDFDNDGVMDLLCGSNADAQLASASGYVLYFHALGPLALGDNRIHASTGGAVPFHLYAGPVNGGRNYAICGSATGTSPGTPLPGGHVVLPINWDPFTDLVWLLVNTPAFQGFLGSLDAVGEADALFDTMGPVPAAAGLTLSFAYALNNPWNYVSNGAKMEIVP